MGRKWNNIKYAKASKDANRSKIYAKFGKEIYMAAKSDPDPESNRTLKAVLDKAKTYNITKEIIDRAINKAKSGVDENYDNIRYEGYGPGGSAVIVDTLTDNVNRTVAEVRSTFKKNDGNMGVSGSVAFMFTPTSIIGINNMNEESLWELFIENDVNVNDIVLEDDKILIYGQAHEYAHIQDALKTIAIEEFLVAEIIMLPNDTITLNEEDFEKFDKLINALEELDDVQEVYHNVEL